MQTGMVTGNPSKGCDRISACAELQLGQAMAVQVAVMGRLLLEYVRAEADWVAMDVALCEARRAPNWQYTMEAIERALRVSGQRGGKALLMAALHKELLEAGHAVEVAQATVERARVTGGLAALGGTDVVVSLN